MENSLCSKSVSESRPSHEAGRIESLVAKLARFYSVMGHLPEEDGALSLMAEILAQSATDEQIAAALTRCTRECRFPVRLPDVLQRIPGNEIPEPEAEARKAWDTVMSFCDRYVQSDVHGGYGIDQGSRIFPPPELGQRILDCVRRCGGWRAFRTADDDDLPFLKKEFLEEYRAWDAVASIDQSLFLLPPAVEKFLAAPRVADVQPATIAARQPAPITFKPKQMPQPLTDAQLRDRQELLRQQAEVAEKLYGATSEKRTGEDPEKVTEAPRAQPLRSSADGRELIEANIAQVS